MKRLLAILFLMAFAVPAGSALAGIIGSPHDIAAQKYTVFGKEETQNVCDYCHVPHEAKGAALWPTPPPSLMGWGRVGPLCYSCHDGVAIVSPNVDASSTVFNPKSHGLLLSNLPQGDDVTVSGLPYTNGTQENIECSTCHDPHDDTNRPFVRAPITELCQKCHKNRENSGYGINNTEGTHPVHKLPKDEVEGPSPIVLQDEFKVGFPSPYPIENGKNTPGVHWTLGGHLASGDSGAMECITCHSVHGREGIGPNYKLLSIDPVKENADLFCEGCHEGKRADKNAAPPFPNPGGTAQPRTYHPVDDDLCNGQGRKVDVTEPAGWTFGKGGEVLCTTCHKAHNAMKNSPILRPPDKSDTFCEACHNKPFGHHLTGSVTPGSNINSGKPHASTRQVQLNPDFPAGITYGKTSGTTLYCSSCHRAHNANCSPILTIDCNKGDSCSICTMCHQKFNPTWQTNDNYKATHFIGDPTQAVIDKVTVTGTVFGTQPGFYDQFPPLHDGPWPESGLASSYGGTTGKEITCCSCHSFDVGNITAGQADQSPYLGPIVAPGYQTEDLTSGLLARAGTFKEWLESDVFQSVIGGNRGTMQKVDKYLCTGCHGLTPNSHPESAGEGFTHPMMNADGALLGQIKTPASLTFNRHVNCESCHSAHEADSRGGFYILKQVEASFQGRSSISSSIPDPYRILQRSDIEFASLCQLCHLDY